MNRMSYYKHTTVVEGVHALEAVIADSCDSSKTVKCREAELPKKLRKGW